MIRLIKAIAIFSLVVFLFVFFYAPIESSDVWWHLSIGRYILQHATFPYADIFSLKDHHPPWIFPQWLGSVFFYGLFELFGLLGLKVFRAVIFSSSLLLFIFYARKKIPFSFLVLLALPMAQGLMSRFFVRPLVFNLIFIQVFLIILFAHHKKDDRRGLFLLPLLSVLWGNIHFGCFIYGGMLLSAFLLTAIVVRCQQRKIRDLLLVSVGFFASFFVNPYGVRAGLYPFETVFGPFFNVAYASITELMPPSGLFSSAYAWFFVLMAGGVWAVFVTRKNAFIYLVLVVAAFFLFLYGRRATDLLIIVIPYVIAEGAQDLLSVPRWAESALIKRADLYLLLLVIVFFWVQIAHLVPRTVFQGGKRERYASLDIVPRHPAAAIDFLKRQGIRGNVLNDEVFGGYILWAGYPQLRPLVDTRWADPELYKAYVAIKTEPGRFMPWAQDTFDLKVAIMDTASVTSQLLVSYLDSSPAWSLSFVDGSIFVYLRKGAFALPASVEDFGVELRRFRLRSEDVPQEEGILRGGFWGSMKDYFMPEPFYIEPLEKGISLFDLGYRDAGLKYIAEARSISDQEVTRGTVSYAVRSWKEAVKT